MTDLNRLLQTLVDQPVAPPAPIEALVDRGRRRRNRRLLSGITAAVTVVGLTVGVASVVDRDPDPVTIRITGSGVQSRGYVATAAGGYEASGQWTLTIQRGNETVVFGNDTSPACGAVGTIREGDRVRAEIRSDESFLRAGPSAHCPPP